MNKSLIVFLLLCIVQTSWAEDSYWQCAAQDDQQKQWIIKSPYERVATTKAYEACKKQSVVPVTCKIPKENCDYFTNGLNTRPMWRCLALDQMSKPWWSEVHSNRDEAAIESKMFCQQHSSMPESCYINLMTCKNLNESN